MKRISILAASAAVAAILACGGGDEGGDDVVVGGGGDEVTSSGGGDAGGMSASDLPSVSLSSPWSSMNLPTAGGNVVVSDSNVLLVAYDGGSISSYASSYGSAVEKAGWSKTDDLSSDDFQAILYSKGSGVLGLASGVEQGITFVYMEMLKDGGSEFKKSKGRKALMRDKLRGRRGGAKAGGKKGGKRGKRSKR